MVQPYCTGIKAATNRLRGSNGRPHHRLQQPTLEDKTYGKVRINNRCVMFRDFNEICPPPLIEKLNHNSHNHSHSHNHNSTYTLSTPTHSVSIGG